MGARVGIVGISGYYSFSFAEALWTNHDVDFAAASTWPAEEKRGVRRRMMTPQEYASRFEVKMYDDPLKMIKTEGLDGVALCGDTDDHKDMVDALASTGVHLFFHKPMCNTIEEADHILGAIRKHGNKSGACNPARFDDAIIQAKALVDGGEIGDLLTVRSLLSHGGSFKSNLPPGITSLQGPWMHLGFYNADNILSFMGWAEVASVFAHYAKLSPEDAQPEDCGKGLVKLKDGRIASMDLYCSSMWSGPLWEIEAIGTKGFIRTSHSVTQGSLFTKDGVKAFQHDHQHGRRVHFGELGAWAKAVEAKVDCELSGERAHRGIEICVAWKRSSDQGIPIAIPVERAR